MKRTAGGLTILFLLLVPALHSQEKQEGVDAVFDRIEETGGTYVWEGIRALEQSGTGSLDEVRKGLTRADGFVRLAAAKVLYSRDQKEEALAALLQVASGKNAGARKAAADLAASLTATDRSFPPGATDRMADEVRRQAGENSDPAVQISLWRAVWNLNQSLEPVRKVRTILDEADRQDLREEAALALAEMDRFIWAKRALADLAQQPTERGRLARAYLRIKEMGDHLPKYDLALIEEAIDVLKENYHDESKIDTAKIVESAARGACASLDPYTLYMDEAMLRQLKEEDLAGIYGGIGARVSMRKDKAGNAWLTIEEPIFSGPAYREGLRSNDRIVEIEGESTFSRDLYDLVRRLRGKAGTPVTFKIMRRGWPKERAYTINREQIQLETTTYRMLPGDIGFLRMSTFGEQDIELVEKAILDMKGMKSMILDLRGNSGGYLRTACKIASYFLEKGQPIVSTRGRGQEQDRRTADGTRLTTVPMIVLVDGGSASASEILAGCLQDHHRATLVGEKTFGKGSVQDMKYLKTTQDKSAVKLTVAKWYLPGGQTVEKDNHAESGVVPDVKAAPAEPDYWKVAEFERLRAGDEIDKYVKTLHEKQPDLFKALAESDGGDAARYPGFDAYYAALDTKASKDDVRELTRELVRKRVQDDQGKPFYLDFQTDTSLQTGILEACKLAKIDPNGVGEYGMFAKAPPPKPNEPEAK